MATQNDEAPTVAAVRASIDSTLSEGTEIVRKITTGRDWTSGVPSSDAAISTEPAKTKISCTETIGAMSDCAQALLGLLERLSQTRDVMVAERVRLRCNWLAQAAQQLRLDLLSEALP